MPDVEKMVDRFSGFITKEQAEFILQGEAGIVQQPPKRRSAASARELSGLSGKERADTEVMSIKDYIYRIFNPVSNAREQKRIVILGEEGATIPFELRGKISEFMDINAFERGDFVSISNAMFDYSDGTLRSLQGTMINKITPSSLHAVTDFSSLSCELRHADIVGRITEINPIRHVSRLGGGSMPMSFCSLSDSRVTIGASFWGSSALVTESLKLNAFVKIEFCDIRLRDGRPHVSANNDSRILSSPLLASTQRK